MWPLFSDKVMSEIYLVDFTAVPPFVSKDTVSGARLHAKRNIANSKIKPVLLYSLRIFHYTPWRKTYYRARIYLYNLIIEYIKNVQISIISKKFAKIKAATANGDSSATLFDAEALKTCR